MQTLLIVHRLSEVPSASEGIFKCFVFIQINLLPFQCLEEAFGKRIVIWISLPGHPEESTPSARLLQYQLQRQLKLPQLSAEVGAASLWHPGAARIPARSAYGEISHLHPGKRQTVVQSCGLRARIHYRQAA